MFLLDKFESLHSHHTSNIPLPMEFMILLNGSVLVLGLIPYKDIGVG